MNKDNNELLEKGLACITGFFGGTIIDRLQKHEALEPYIEYSDENGVWFVGFYKMPSEINATDKNIYVAIEKALNKIKEKKDEI